MNGELDGWMVVAWSRDIMSVANLRLKAIGFNVGLACLARIIVRPTVRTLKSAVTQLRIHLLNQWVEDFRILGFRRVFLGGCKHPTVLYTRGQARVALLYSLLTNDSRHGSMVWTSSVVTINTELGSWPAAEMEAEGSGFPEMKVRRVTTTSDCSACTHFFWEYITIWQVYETYLIDDLGFLW